MTYKDFVEQYGSDAAKQMLALIVAVIKKREPKTPAEIDDEYGYFKCPTCGELIYCTESRFEDHKYCLNCGQAIYWIKKEVFNQSTDMQGKKILDEGWIPAERELPPNAKHKGAFCPRVRVMTKFGETYGWYNPDYESWYILVWFMTERYLDNEIDFERGDKPKIVRLPDKMNDTKHILVAWQPLPETYRPGKSELTVPEKCKNCIHHKIVQGLDICDFVEYYTDYGTPVPYPYFFKQEYPCKGHKERGTNYDEQRSI